MASQVLERGVLDHELAARDGGQADERADLDVVGADPCWQPRSRSAPSIVKDVRADALDLRAHRDQQAAQVLHVRLAGGVGDASSCPARAPRP